MTRDQRQQTTFEPYLGQHCETTATGNLLKHIGVELTEPMLFGLGEGLSFIFWNMKTLDFPFIGGRVKPDILTENICRRLNLTLTIKQTASVRKAWENVRRLIDNGTPVGLKLDCFHLEYFATKIHFAGHYATLYDYDDEYAYLIDTGQQGGKVRTSLKSLKLARSEKGPMSSKNLSYSISSGNRLPDLKTVIPAAIGSNAESYLNPPITNISYKGIFKASREIKKWFRSSSNLEHEFCTTAMLMERAGTGGSMFRNLYRDFLAEARDLLELSALDDAHNEFREIASLWKDVAELFDCAGKTSNVRHIDEAAELLVDLSAREKDAMDALLTTFGN